MTTGAASAPPALAVRLRFLLLLRLVAGLIVTVPHVPGRESASVGVLRHCLSSFFHLGLFSLKGGDVCGMCVTLLFHRTLVSRRALLLRHCSLSRCSAGNDAKTGARAPIPPISIT